jgi:VanZ family protein
LSDFSYFKIWFFVGVLLVVAVLYLSLTATPPPIVPSFEYGDKFGHLLAYSVLTGWFGQLYSRFTVQFWIFVAFCFMGVSLEFVQGMGETRVFEYADMAANTLGAGLGWWLTRTVFAGTLLKIEQKILIKTGH